MAAKHDNTQDGGRKKEDVDASKIKPPKDEQGGKRGEDNKGGKK